MRCKGILMTCLVQIAAAACVKHLSISTGQDACSAVPPWHSSSFICSHAFIVVAAKLQPLGDTQCAMHSSDADLRQLAGRQPVKAVICNSPVQSSLAAKKGKPAPTATGVTLPLAVAGNRHGLERQCPSGQSPSLPSGRFPSQPASANSMPGSRVSAQARSRPTGLPLPTKASPAGPMGRVVGKQAASQKGKGSDLSVTEMMQWLDSKLGQPTAAPVTSPAAASG